jgi:hypothetical protein
MKRISNIYDLEYEKLRLRVRQLELEKQMSRSWKHIKTELAFSPKARRSNQVNNDAIRNGNPILSGVLDYGASFLSHKLGMIAGKKIESTAELVLERLVAKLASLTVKKNRN